MKMKRQVKDNNLSKNAKKIYSRIEKGKIIVLIKIWNPISAW